MLLNRETWKLHRMWVYVFVAGLITSVFSLLTSNGLKFPGGSSTLGYSFGVIAGLIIVFEVLLWPRKKLFRRQRLGRVRTWMAAHIWLGLLTVPLALVHAGIPWGGSLASWTMILLMAVVASGIFGLALQQYLPGKMTRAAPGETIYSQIENVASQNVTEADALISATCGVKVGETEWSEIYPMDKSSEDAGVYVGATRSIANIFGTAVVTKHPENPIPNTLILKSAYEGAVRDYLVKGKEGTSALRNEAKQEMFLEDLSSKLDPEAQFVVKHLKQWCRQRRQLDRQSRLHLWLHCWLAVHLPLSLGLLVLLIWHAIVASKYSGIFSFY